MGVHVPEIGGLIQETGAKTVLDYGCGKACIYKQDRVHEKWGVKPTFYDPGVEGIDKKPEGQFDGVICTDVLEHILDPEPVIHELLSYATRFCFMSISCKPGNPWSKFHDGTRFHVSVHPKEWWLERIPEKEGVKVVVRFDV